ncbi:MAG TPA: electron transfer flavoprotein subunit alpha/FixB family protein, partial [Gemmatimonadota bacterium]|nr:electron transfer flavoprotein subunit alpha/FixB family protein [Gemmatimonadota bacterium]
AALGKPLEAVVLGAGVRGAAEKVAAREVERVRLIEDPKLETYTPDPYAAALRRAVEAEKPDYLLFPHTYQVRDWVPRLAAGLDAGFISDVVDFRADGDEPVFVRQPYQGKLNADCAFAEGEGPRLVSFQAGAYLADDAAKGDAPAEVVEQSVDLADVEIRTDVLDTFQEVENKVDLSRADVIVAVGRGIGKEENLGLVEELASALGGQLAASRPVCDNEWLPMDRQIGSSGQTVAPRLYLAVGISGAIQHLVGMKNSGTIVAINKDPNAPIFSVADYGIVGDLFEIVPALTAKVKEARGA